jgi:hypothetical protein
MSVARGVGLIAASVFVAILLMEVGLRIMGYSRPVFYRYDEVLGANLRPGVAGYYKKEDLIYIRLNDDGMRGPDRPYVKPASTVRVAVMGDSFTEGFQVGYEDLFTTVLERALAKCPAGDAEVFERPKHHCELEPRAATRQRGSRRMENRVAIRQSR